ncbi:MAG: malate synthase A [Rhizobiales bacterium]|nr:malate synthase A [Hyphomicrobiales bacterium]
MARRRTTKTSRAKRKASTARPRPKAGTTPGAKGRGKSRRSAAKTKSVGRISAAKFRKSPRSKAAPHPGAARKAQKARTSRGLIAARAGKPHATAGTAKRPRAPFAVRTAVRTTTPVVSGVAIQGAMGPRYAEVLTARALAFLADLHRRFDRKRKQLLAARKVQQQRYDAGALPDFLVETQHIREGDWKIASIPNDLLDRRVEITGPVDRKMIVNALNSGAKVFMADFEDANSPTWANNLEGQINLKDRWSGKIDFIERMTSKSYRVKHRPAVMIVRPRGWHLDEVHLSVDGEPIAGALFDFGLYLFHNHRALKAKGTGPYFYLPKLETHLEARLWNDVFDHAQKKLGMTKGTIKATVLIETLPAAFEMDEILYELRDHITGLNAGRWDYIFSFIKKFAKNPNYVLPDRGQVVMGKAFLGAYAALLVKTCHRRGAFAMGGMAAQIPVKGDAAANKTAFAKVQADKEREVREGHDGTWVAHPALVPVAKEVFDRLMPGPNQLGKLRADVQVTRDQLLQLHDGTKTEEGFRLNIRVGVQYIEAWLSGRGAVPIYNLMEDAATAEISRAQIWQWLKYGATLDTGVKVTSEFFDRALKEEMERVKTEIGAKAFAAGRFPEAIKLFRDISVAGEFAEFLTIPAYKLIV